MPFQKPSMRCCPNFGWKLSIKTHRFFPAVLAVNPQPGRQPVQVQFPVDRKGGKTVETFLGFSHGGNGLPDRRSHAIR